MSESEIKTTLKTLDEDRAKFKSIMEEAIRALPSDHKMLVFFLYFASMIFEFNGYQVPPRTDTFKATQDALGLTDLWSEFLEEVGYHEENKRVIQS